MRQHVTADMPMAKAFLQSGSMLTLLLCSSLLRAQSLQDTSRALDLIVKTADSICTKFDPSGSSSSVDVNGAAGVEVSKLVRQLVDLKVSGAAKWTKTEYQGLLQADLPEAIKNVTECRKLVFKQLSDKLIQQPVSLTPNGCKISGYVFERDSSAPVAGALIDAYTFQPLTNVKASALVATHIAISGPSGRFSGDCRGIAESSFPLRLGVRRKPGGSSELLPARIDFNDIQTEVNLSIMRSP